MKDMPQTVLFSIVLTGLPMVASGIYAVVFLGDYLAAPQTSGDSASYFDLSLALFTASWWLIAAHRKGKPIGWMVQIVLAAIASLCPAFSIVGISLIVSMVRNQDVRKWYTPDAV